MSHEKGFLQAIIENPDDDGLRLIYADWLEERGDPRGKFIRVQCQLAHLGSDAPYREELKKQETALLLEHEKTWSLNLPDEELGWIFSRGFIESVMATRSSVCRLSELFGIEPVVELEIYNPAPPDEESYFQEISEPTAIPIDLLRRLQILRINGYNNCMECSGNAAPHFKHLHTLEVSHSFMTMAHMAPLLLREGIRLPHLQKLDLHANIIGNIDNCVERFHLQLLHSLAICRNFPSLQELDLSHNRLTWEDARLLEQHAPKNLLIYLDPQQNTDIPMAVIHRLRGSRL